jgi:hypothetical protein
VMAERRRFPSPWQVREISGGWMVVDANGVRLAYIYSMAANETASASTAGEKLTGEEARRIASGIARLPEYRFEAAVGRLVLNMSSLEFHVDGLVTIVHGDLGGEAIGGVPGGFVNRLDYLERCRALPALVAFEGHIGTIVGAGKALADKRNDIIHGFQNFDTPGPDGGFVFTRVNPEGGVLRGESVAFDAVSVDRLAAEAASLRDQLALIVERLERP